MKKMIFNYSISLDKETEHQFRSCYSKDYVLKAALMPDAHKGYVAPIGSVIVTRDYIVPSWVGFDIGCGVIAVKILSKEKELIEKIEKNRKKIYSNVKKGVPMGLGEINKDCFLHKEIREKYQKILDKLERKEHDKRILNYIKQVAPRHLGTLGSGNHFAELSISKNKKELWLVIHTGSRGIGHKVAEKYMIEASGSKDKEAYEKTFPLKTNSQLGKEYLNILDFGLEYALLNRLEISLRIIDSIENVLKIKLKGKLWANKNHNHAILERKTYVHRKGATPAKKEERGTIPANMRDGSYLVKGLGNPKFLNSSSHGAGRRLSRTKARELISLKDFKKQMSGITANLTEKIIDEAPEAYKSISSVMDAQKKSVKIVKHLLPIINWKG